MEELQRELAALKALLEQKRAAAKETSYSWGRITTVGAVCFVIGMVVGNLLA